MGPLLAIPVAMASWSFVATSAVRVDVVTVAAPVGGDRPPASLTAGGYVRASKVVYVVPRVAGRIASLEVGEGDLVEAGDVIAVIDSRDLEQEVAEARANHGLAEANLAKLRFGSRPEEVAETKAKVRAVALATENAGRELARNKALFDAGLLSAQSFEHSNTEYLVSESNLAAARQSLALVEAGPRQEEIQIASSAVAAAQARLTGAANRLSYAKVRAPVSGRVLRKFRDAGDFVSPQVPYLEGYDTIAVGSPVVALIDLGAQEVSADINETDIAKVSLDQPVEISPNAYPAEVLQGSVSQISPRADKNKNTIEVKATLEKTTRVLPYDMSVKLSFMERRSDPKPKGMRIPSSALLEKEGGHFVFVASDSRASLRAVKIGSKEHETVTVESGLAAGDRVIVSNVSALEDGRRIRLK